MVGSSFAGTMNIYQKESSTAKPYKGNLNEVGSIVFAADRVGAPMKLKVKNADRKNLYDEELGELLGINFSTKKDLGETMTIEWRNERNDTLRKESALYDVESIEIIDMGNVDSDGDGLTDYEEIYIYETNPYDKDTDGDGYDDKMEVYAHNTNTGYFNPKVADIPEVEVRLTEFPRLIITKTTSSGTTESESISEGEGKIITESVNMNYTNTSAQQHGWKVSFGGKVSWGGNLTKVGYEVSVNAEANGSYTQSVGRTTGTSRAKTISENYAKAVSKAKSEGTTITGAKVQVMAEVVNTGHIAYTIDGLTGMLSVYNADGQMKHISEVKAKQGSHTLEAGKSINLEFEEAGASLSFVQQYSKYSNSVFLSGISMVISKTHYSEGGIVGKDDFETIYTNVANKTATIVLDYGPIAKANDVKTFRVATNLKPNENSVGLSDKYKGTSLKQIFDYLNIKYKEGSVTLGDKTVTGLISIDTLECNSSTRSAWFVSVQKALNPSRARIYSVTDSSFSLSDIKIGAGDRVNIFYSTDKDGDGLSLHEETLHGTSDEKVDTDGDGISDYDEIYGWSHVLDEYGQCLVAGEYRYACGPFKTNPSLVDTDGDGVNDKDDPDPVNRELGTSSELETILVEKRNFALSKEYREDSTYVNEDGQIFAVQDTVYNWSMQEPVHKKSVNVRFVPHAPIAIDANVKILRNGKAIPYRLVSELENAYEFTLENVRCGMDTVALLMSSEASPDKYVVNNIIIDGSMDPLNKDISFKTTESRDEIIVEFYTMNDDRIEGYVILRGVGTKDNHNAELMKPSMDNLPPTDRELGGGEYYLNTDLTVAAVIPAKDVTGKQVAFNDKVGGGSPYYTYKVYAYTYDDKKQQFVYIPITKCGTKSVGRIQVTYQVISVGTEYLWSVDMAGRFDMRVKADLFSGTDSIHGYNYWFQNAGTWKAGNTVIWETMADDWRRDEDSNDQPVDRGEHTTEIGSKGMTILFKNDADVRSSSEKAEATISWPYTSFVNALTAETPTGKDGDAPLMNREMTFTWGKNGISYDEACSSCGSEPHAGYKMKFNYKFVD